MSDTERMPDVVYHYTSMDTLTKVIQNRQLWATNVRYLNDVSEHSLFVATATEQVGDFAQDHPGVNVGRFYEREIEESRAPNPFYDLPFITSFAAKNDSLTHWRSYCPKYNGVSIGFRTQALRKARLEMPTPLQAGTLIPEPVFSRVTYVKPGDSGSITAALQRAYARAEYNLNVWGPVMGTDHDLGDEFFSEVQAVAAFHKHSSFEDEREFRLVVDGMRYRRDLLRYRSSASSLIPYIKLEIPRIEMPEDVTGRLWTAIASITVGPTPNKELAVDALVAMVEERELTAVRIDATDVPYRDW